MSDNSIALPLVFFLCLGLVTVFRFLDRQRWFIALAVCGTLLGGLGWLCVHYGPYVP